jgi:transcription termination/antitermination protein NusG
MEPLWYALHVRSRFENLVATQLGVKGYETFLPTYTSVRRWSDRIKSATLPLFPNYVFCRFNVHARLPILVTPGVNFVVATGKMPTPVDDDEIASLRYLVHADVTPQPCPYVAVGEPVQVIAGPLRGLTGIVLRTKGYDRLILSISLLMRSVAVQIDRANVELLPEALRGCRRLCGSYPVTHADEFDEKPTRTA